MQYNIVFNENRMFIYACSQTFLKKKRLLKNKHLYAKILMEKVKFQRCRFLILYIRNYFLRKIARSTRFQNMEQI